MFCVVKLSRIKTGYIDGVFRLETHTADASFDFLSIQYVDILDPCQHVLFTFLFVFLFKLLLLLICAGVWCVVFCWSAKALINNPAFFFLQ